MSQRYALLSVSDKTEIETIAQALVDQGVKLLSTGGTMAAIEAAGIPVASVESITNFPEMMDGRVKTLHPKIHGGLLARRDVDDHLTAMREHAIPMIDFVIANLYPFKETIAQAGVTMPEAIEQIDIGGPSMLRSAAKNYASVTVVTDPSDYATLMTQLHNNDGQTTLAFRQYLASKVFELTAHYDATIAQYFADQLEADDSFEANDWDHITLTYQDERKLRYGENSHQQAKFYSEINAANNSLAQAKQLHGKELSYNNYRDANAAIAINEEFTQPAAVAVKHMNPCGVGVAETIEEAFDLCYLADSMSIFGGIVVLNRPVTKALAEKLHKIFLEIVVAPSFDDEALEILTKKKNIRLLELELNPQKATQWEYSTINGGLLAQTTDISEELVKEQLDAQPDSWKTVTDREPSLDEVRAMNFGMRVCKFVKSNAIVISNGQMTLGVGAGQMNRIGAAQIALKQAQPLMEKVEGPFIMASDAFFPMDDTVAEANKYGITAVIQPGGSIRDQDSIDFCNAHEMAMVTTGVRHFRH